MQAVEQNLTTYDGAQVSHEYTRECAAFFAEVAQIFGVARSVGQIYGLLYASPGQLCFSDIVKRLQISKGSASQGLQLLRTLGAIRVAPVPRKAQGAAPEASRRDYFEPELSLRKLVSGVLRERVTPLATGGTNRLIRLRELADKELAKDFCMDRVKQLETWRGRLKAILPILNVLLGPKR